MTDNTYNRLEAEVSIRVRESGYTGRGELISIRLSQTVDAIESEVDATLTDLVQAVASRVGAQTEELFSAAEEPDSGNGGNGSASRN